MARLRRLCVLLIGGVMLLSACGCCYLQNRGADLLDCVDFGLTFTKRPTFAAYFRTPIVPVAGALGGYVDGYFVGVGGGNAGLMRHYEKSYGMFLKDPRPDDPDAFWSRIPIPLILSCYEEVAYGDFDKDDSEQVHAQRVGLVGLFQGPFPGPDYFFGCPHYLHIGWIGVVVTPRYNEWLDFIVGFTTLDISGDDGRPRGYWPGQPRKEVALRADRLSHTYVGRARWRVISEPMAAPSKP